MYGFACAVVYIRPPKPPLNACVDRVVPTPFGTGVGSAGWEKP